MNYETDEINKENMNEFWTFIAVKKSEKYVTYNKIREAITFPYKSHTRLISNQYI